MGDFAQCLTARAPFPTQYCLTVVTANVPQPKTTRNPFSLYFDPNDSVVTKLYKFDDVTQQSRNVVKMGWCLPASCTPSNIEIYTNDYFSKIDHPLKEENVTFTIKISSKACTSSNSQRGFDGLDISFCILTTVLVLLVIFSTTWEYCKDSDKSHNSSFLHRIFLAFSAKTNFPQLNKAESSNESLSILYGIRTFSIFMIILDHRFGTFVGGAVSNVDYIEQNYRNTLVSYIFHGDLFVDTFFVISGLLVVYNLLNTFDKKYINPGLIIFMRYLRLTPAYAFVLFYACTLFYKSGNGPLWKAIVGSEVQDCRKNLWASLLYISNYFDTPHMCLPHTWYLPCDFHYFIVAIGLVLIIRKDKKYGLAMVFILTIVSFLIPFVLILVYESSAFLRFLPDFLRHPKTHRDYELLYIKSHVRATPYFIGMLAGYTYYRMKGSGRILSTRYTTVLALLSVFLLMVCMYGGVVFYDPYHKYNALESASYGALHRTIWALGSFGIMYTVSFGTFTFLHKCLSWSPWIPLSKLVFGAYLWHFLFQIRALGKENSTMVFNFFDVILYGLGDICLAFMLALGLYLTVETPMRRILKEIFFPNKPKKDEIKTEEYSATTREVSKV
ncbi:nose resistant to fluoxetine protein 6-like [Anoplophora glabripennis]|uniref:nose resistant to fluoxetine protein 6-like n=1 Tax=Anoplophora glabripennis TaxID=217634 RepID=UPI000874C1AF|nr:nose resistant to fluoxetine protein 6-like [Anoplophora glabripennis]